MRRPAILAAILVSLAVLTAASPASAMYHPTMGRWVQRDPIGYADGMNLQEYVGGRPVRAVDPTGFGQTVAIGAIKGKEPNDPVDKAIKESADLKPSHSAQEFYEIVSKAYNTCMANSKQLTPEAKHCECCIEKLVRDGHGLAGLGGGQGFDKLTPTRRERLKEMLCKGATFSDMGCNPYNYSAKGYGYHLDEAMLLSQKGGVYEGYIGYTRGLYPNAVPDDPVQNPNGPTRMEVKQGATRAEVSQGMTDVVP
ncbi:MAG: hypothetical protein NTY65_00435 [Planctomycetota bacterium]|nr:hypothetical protein [Planctomycetota bacterium]